MKSIDEPSKALRRLSGRIEKLERAVNHLARVGPNVDRVVALDYEPSEILLHAAGRRERSRAFACRKEPWTVTWLDGLPGGTLWDIGANVGAYSLIGALRPSGGLHVVSVEPSFATFESLCRNIILNEATDRIIPLPVMLGDQTSVSTLGYSDLNAGSAMHAGGAPSLKEGFESVYNQPMLTYRLDDLVQTFDLPPPDFIKLDVDGAEAHVMRGAPVTLRSVQSAIVEVSGRERNDVYAAMSEAGLTLEHEDRRQRSEGPTAISYALFGRLRG